MARCNHPAARVKQGIESDHGPSIGQRTPSLRPVVICANPSCGQTLKRAESERQANTYVKWYNNKRKH